MRQVASDLPGLHLVLIRGGVRGVADVRAGVKPVVGADGDGHEAERGEGARGGQQGLRPSVTPRHGGSCCARPPRRGARGANGCGRRERAHLQLLEASVAPEAAQ